MGPVRVASLLLGVFLFGAVLSCGDDNFGINNVSPTGSVGGLIVDAGTMKAMEGVKVVVLAGGAFYPSADKPAVTDAKGYFSVKDVPAGDLIIEVTPADPALYRAIRMASSLPNSAGDYPLGNSTLSLGPIGLLPLTDAKSTVTVQLVTPAGVPAAEGFKAFLRTNVEWVDFSNGGIAPHGVMIIEGTSDKAGLVKFAGAPDYSKFAGLVGGGISDAVTIQVPPYDSNKDGYLDFLGCEKVLYLSRRSGAIPTLVLRSANRPSQLAVEAASIAAFMGKTGNQIISSPNGPIYLTFNMPLLEDRIMLSLFDELGNPVPAKPTAEVNENLLTITFSNLTAGAEYNLDVRAAALIDGETIESGSIGAPFFVPSEANLTIAGIKRDTVNNRKIIVTFNEPIGNNVGLSGYPVVYFDYDLNTSGNKGDPGEIGASSSTVQLSIEENDPPGAAGKSGYSRTWSFTLPAVTGSTDVTVVPPGTGIQLLFTRASNPPERPDGSLVPDFKTGVAVPQ